MIRRHIIILAFLLMQVYADVWAQDRSIQGRSETEVRELFDRVDVYLEKQYYDSAQLWLNRIPSTHQLIEPTRFSYYFFSRQAEIDYYNGLHQLGITNARRGLAIALKRNDRILLQDAYNMLGLLHLSMDSGPAARNYFLYAIGKLTAPPYPETYLYQSMPHHIYGNIAEAYEKMQMFDSALYFSHQSLHEALSIDNKRGIAIAYNSLARVSYYSGQNDSALKYYRMSDSAAVMAKAKDIQLLDQSIAAGVYAATRQYVQMEKHLASGFSLISQYPKINTFFKREFLKEARKMYAGINEQAGLRKTTDMLLRLEEETNKKHFDQVQFILDNSIANEARYIKAQSEQDEQSKQLRIRQLYIVILILSILAILMVFYQYSVREKLKLSVLKNKISQDLHDDVGASLSSITMSAALAEKLVQVNPEKTKTVLQSISTNAEDGISTLSDIVWAMKPVTDSGTTFESKVKNYGYNLLSVKDISCDYKISPLVEARLSNIEVRKNLLLVVKEAFNNIAKHSGATQVFLLLEMEGKNRLKLQVKDNGVGFDDAGTTYGNGVQNMRRRIEDIKGVFLIEANPGNGTLITSYIPL
jgi:signal transduction histidine kinase